MQKIIFTRGPGPYSPNDWIAMFEDPQDAEPIELRLTGYGKTKEEAEDDLMMEWEDAQ